MAGQTATENIVDFDDALREEPLRIDAKPVAIRPAAKGLPPVSPPAKPRPSSGGAARAYGTESLNSRTTGELGLGPWTMRWKTEIKPGLNAPIVLQAGSRILLPGEYEWQLFGRDGAALASGARGAGEVVLNEANGLFFVPDPSGTLAAQRLLDGRRIYAMNVFSGKSYRRSVIWPRATRLHVVSVEYVKLPHSRLDPNFSAIEVYELGDSPQVNQFGLLTSAEPKVRLTRASTVLLAAAKEETVVLAIEDRLLVANRDLEIKGVLTSKFLPVAMSLDDDARMYLVVRADEKQAFWIVTPQGELAAYAFPEGTAPITAPPVIGYDQRAYVVIGDRVMAFGPDAKVVWELSLPARLVKLAVTADNKLLAASGNRIVALDAKGESSPVVSAEDAEFATPPVVTEQGELIIASATHLYCFSSQRKKGP